MRLNFLNTAGYFIVGFFIYTVITKFTDNPAIFINPEGLVVVGGGLFVAGLASFPFRVHVDTWSSLWRAFTRPVKVPTDEAREIVKLSTIAQRGLTRLESQLDYFEDDFLRSGVELMLDGVTPKAFLNVVQKRISEYQERSARSVNVMLTLSKFAPALGLAATVLGLVQLLGKLGDADMTQLGTGMAIALSGTFYGIMMANLIFQPLAELIQMNVEAEIKRREMLMEGLHSILERHEPLVIGELVNSFLPDSKRIEFTDEIADIAKDAQASESGAAAA